MRILIADDHQLVRDTLAAFLANETDIEVDQAEDFGGAMQLVTENQAYDLVLLDYNMPGMNALEGLEKAMAASDGRPVAIISGTAPRQVAEDALEAGAAGFLPKTMPAKSLIHAVRFMAAGEQYAPVSFMTEKEPETSHPLADKLSPRETEVLDGLCRGLSNKEIARELDLQEVTIKLHVKTLCRKLGARNRTQAAMIARDQGMF